MYVGSDIGAGIDKLKIISKTDKVVETVDGYSDVSKTEKNLRIVESRINIANGRTRFTPLRPRTGNPLSAGFEHVIEGHFDVPISNSRSVFSITQDKLKIILQCPNVVKAPVKAIQGGQYIRTVNIGESVGNTALKFGGNKTTWIEVYTDKAGNLITTYPIPVPK